MIEYCAIYDTSTGRLEWKTTGQPGAARNQRIEPTMAALVMPYSAYIALPDDLQPLKAAVIDLVNAGAGEFRKRFITDVPGQMGTYQNKEAEARRWASGDDPATVPYLAAEASATNRMIDALAAEVVQVADAWRALDVKIEARRRKATVEMIAADNIAAIVAAGMVDWPALLTP